MANNTSIFDFADKFGIKSPFGNWLPEAEKGFYVFADIPAVAAFLKKNHGKVLQFTPSLYVKEEYRKYIGPFTLDTTSPEVADVPLTSAPSTPDDKPENLKVQAFVNSKEGNINMLGFPRVDFDFDQSKEQIVTWFYFPYEKADSEKTEDKYALIFRVRGFHDLLLFLDAIGYILSASGERDIRYFFNTAFKKSEGKANEIDWLYEQAPDFILLDRPDNQLLKDLKLLSEYKIDGDGTNENKAILNILKNIGDAKSFSDWVNNDPDPLRKIFRNFSKKYITDLVVALIRIGEYVWTDKDYAEGDNKYYHFGVSQFDLDMDGHTDMTIAGTCVYRKEKKLFEVGYNIHSFDNGLWFAKEGKSFKLGAARPFAPLKLINTEEEEEENVNDKPYLA